MDHSLTFEKEHNLMKVLKGDLDYLRPAVIVSVGTGLRKSGYFVLLLSTSISVTFPNSMRSMGGSKPSSGSLLPVRSLATLENQQDRSCPNSVAECWAHTPRSFKSLRSLESESEIQTKLTLSFPAAIKNKPKGNKFAISGDWVF